MARVRAGLGLLAAQARWRLSDVVDVGGGAYDGAGQTRLGVDADVRLHGKAPLMALVDWVHLGIARARAVFRGGRRRNDRGFRDRASAQERSLLGKVGMDGGDDRAD